MQLQHDSYTYSTLQSSLHNICLHYISRLPVALLFYDYII